MTRRSDKIGRRVRVDHDNGSHSFGVVVGMSRRGHKIHTDEGKVIYAAWWRLLTLREDERKTNGDE